MLYLEPASTRGAQSSATEIAASCRLGASPGERANPKMKNAQSTRKEYCQSDESLPDSPFQLARNMYPPHAMAGRASTEKPEPAGQSLAAADAAATAAPAMRAIDAFSCNSIRFLLKPFYRR